MKNYDVVTSFRERSIEVQFFYNAILMDVNHNKLYEIFSISIRKTNLTFIFHENKFKNISSVMLFPESYIVVK